MAEIEDKPFDDSTKLKLEIFGDCFEEWLPVFIHNNLIQEIYVYDFFSGKGKDCDGYHGSPLVLIEKSKGKDRKYCSIANKKIVFTFNDVQKKKADQLKNNIDNYIKECCRANNCRKCSYQYEVENNDFKKLFYADKIQTVLENNRFGKFILMDQYGFSDVDKDVFQKLINYPKLDFIFFISTSFISRFREHPNTKKYIETEKLNFDDAKPKDCHRIIADYFRSMIPEYKEYYIHHFTIQKENKANFYGLVFGTGHTLGMEKFLKICWQKDVMSGEANFNISNDYEKQTLFYDESMSNRKIEIKELLIKEIYSFRIKDNISGIKYVMKNGGQPSIFVEVIDSLIKEEKIEVVNSKKNSQKTNVHQMTKYEFKVLKED